MKIMQHIIFLTFLATMACLDYPNVRRNDSLVEDHFGQQVKNAYRWLEDPYSPETQKFILEQNELTDSFVNSSEAYAKIRKRLTDMLNYTRTSDLAQHGSRFFYSSNPGLLNSPIFYVKESLDAEPKVFLDPNKFSPDGLATLNPASQSMSSLTFSPNGEWCAYQIMTYGSNWVKIKIRHVASGLDLNETFTRVKFTSVAWNKNSEGFFYIQFDEFRGKEDGMDPTAAAGPKVFYHTLNTDQSKDILVADLIKGREDYLIDIELSEDGKILHLMPGTTNKGSWYYIRLNEPISSKMTIRPVVSNLEGLHHLIANYGDRCIMLTEDAPFARIVAVDLNKPQKENWVELVRASHHLIESANVVKDKLIVKYLSSGLNKIKIHSLSDGKFLATVDLPEGIVDTITGKSEEEIFITVSSLIMPERKYQLNISKEPYQLKLVSELKIKGLDQNDLVMKRIMYKSKDGTEVPMFITHRKNMSMDGSRPALLYGYGVFGINQNPEFDSFGRRGNLGNFFANDLNGVYALAGIRGGNELGLEWHESGWFSNKQNVFDDFIAAGEYLISNKYTNKEKLVIEGYSNGGLLTAVVSNQRPDLFAAVISGAGTGDMVRFQKFTSAYYWVQEWGNPEVEKDFKYIFKYSPYHNVPKNTSKFPAMLITTGDHDDTVVPLHYYKLTAELQHFVAPNVKTPILLRTETKSGHSFITKTTSKLIDYYTDVFTFIVKSLNIDYGKN